MKPRREPSHAAHLLDPPAAAGLLHYALAMACVAATFGGLAAALGNIASSDTAVSTQDAVVIELPPLEAGSHPQGDDAPPQEAAPASAGAQAPQPTPSPPEPAILLKPSARDVANLPPASTSDAVLQQPAPPPPQAQAPASAPQDAHHAGAPTPAQAASDDADAFETRRASAHLITLWQKALMGRLQAARHGLATHATGIARIAFAIDHKGRLVSAQIARGSGSAGAASSARSWPPTRGRRSTRGRPS